MVKETDEAMDDDRDVHRVLARMHKNADDLDYFTAVSCCWDESETSTLTTLNEKLLSITSNLASLLEQEARRPDITRHHCGLWVDAVCINQTDIIGRNAQVQQVWRTYERAAAVAMWLGPKMDRPPPAMKRAAELTTKCLTTPAKAVSLSFAYVVTMGTGKVIGGPMGIHL